MTSNIGSDVFSKKGGSIGFHTTTDTKVVAKKEFDLQKEKVLERLKDWMKPELLNRLDFTIVFRPLEKDHLMQILKHQLDAFLAQWK